MNKMKCLENQRSLQVGRILTHQNEDFCLMFDFGILGITIYEYVTAYYLRMYLNVKSIENYSVIILYNDPF